jgi:hypothetical protein
MKAILHRFALWFGSAAGVIQTAVFVTVVVVAEFLRPSMDPNGFWFLFWATVYSAVTQPLLAYSTSVTDESNAEALKFLRYLSERILEEAKEIHDDVDPEHDKDMPEDKA